MLKSKIEKFEHFMILLKVHEVILKVKFEAFHMLVENMKWLNKDKNKNGISKTVSIKSCFIRLENQILILKKVFKIRVYF